jgi:ABC-type cobalamin/Fe3+-siderophores transport system ATPase subunit
MIELKNLTGGYEGVARVRDVSATFCPGEITAVVGPNGCGKSTLLKLIARLLAPFSGAVLLDKTHAGTFGRREFAQRVSILPQSRRLPNMSVGALVMHGRYPYLGYPRRYSRADREMVREAMALTGVDHLRHKPLAGLSGGERQKAYIALVIAQDTDVVLLDEPTTYLDIGHQFEMMQIARALKLRQKTVVMVLHDLNLALGYADRMVVMQDAAIKACAAPAEICRDGLIDEVFGIQAQMVVTPLGRQYVFAPGKGEKIP